jgi:phosphoribosyl-ATP pyrophosphohydrolase
MSMVKPAADLRDTLTRLSAVIEHRRAGDPNTSYVAKLTGKGGDAVLKKVGEEATELVMAAKDGAKDRIVAEAADLWFHTLLVLSMHGLSAADVLAELTRREGESGLEEFAKRKMDARDQNDARGGLTTKEIKP